MAGILSATRVNLYAMVIRVRKGMAASVSRVDGTSVSRNVEKSDYEILYVFSI